MHGVQPAGGGRGPGTGGSDAAGAVDADVDAPVDAQEGARAALAKHDWNGLRVMMTESEARAALAAIGFALTPTRTVTFLVYDPVRYSLRAWRKKEGQLSLIIMETRREKRLIKSAWGVSLAFFKNRLFAFSPQYFAGAVDLVEPDDELVTAGAMEERLRATFGPPGVVDGTIDFFDEGAAAPSPQKGCVWGDESLVVFFRAFDRAGIARYTLTFFSPRGMKSAWKYLSKGADGGQDAGG